MAPVQAETIFSTEDDSEVGIFKAGLNSVFLEPAMAIDSLISTKKYSKGKKMICKNFAPHFLLSFPFSGSDIFRPIK